ncbi:MAG TPA: carboxymuconolactone decarboxylase family protein [Candidatus Acidoferrales bacterium]|nr:carboxymuconolactone decarboxylase family protein [Candidatus Acidoferrales bacterium]
MRDQTVGSFERGARLLQKMLGPREARRVRAAWRRLAPDFERYVITFLSGEIWSRPGLDRRTRSLCTISVLTALGRTNGLELNIRMALRNGATRPEIIEALLHIAPYAGFPAVWDALVLAGRVFSGARGMQNLPRPSRRATRGPR